MALFDRKNLLPVMTVGAQVLKQQAQPVLQVNDDIRAFAKDMIHAMREYDGIGLAAPQAGRSLRLVVLEVPGSDEEELSPGEAAMLPQMPMVLVNPRIIGRSDSVCERDEGCLSVPGIYAPVVRSERVVLQSELLDGSVIEYECGGLLGRCIQHELDHLDGFLFTDRLAPEEYRFIERQLESLERAGKKTNYIRRRK
ncbi:MAG: peptide deformylase [Lentisphaeria bacterium]|nr:peptide deformylase [Lentisphaeria bacterium]MBO5764657.1 peptide deformylase [Lentisphaeria bacterium]MBO5990023.1 peptide deformylase [Lentisphaeria bacterium]MBO7153326.1 peptide deformylase [Lentisphaeria bacterium]